VTFEITGGNADYQFAVNASANGTGSDITSWIPVGTGLATKDYVATETGDYVIYVKDAKGCIAKSNVVKIVEPAPLTLGVKSGSKVNVSCNGGSDGQFDIDVTGGGWVKDGFTQNYVFALTEAGLNSSSNTTGLFTGLAAGTYTVYVGTSNTPGEEYPVIRCADKIQVTVTEPAPYQYQVSITDVKCKGGSDGTLKVKVLGGGTPSATDGYYIAIISTNQTTPVWHATKVVSDPDGDANTYIFTGLSHKIYTVMIKDANGCEMPVGIDEPENAEMIYYSQESFEVNEPAAALTASVTWNKDVTCHGETDGQFTINAAGGAGGYLYAAKNSLVDGGHPLQPAPGASDWKESNVFTVGAGTWIIWVMDQNGCVVGGEGTIQNPVIEWRVQIAEPAAVGFSLTSTDVVCNGTATGTVNVSSVTSDAGAPYTFNISGTDAAGNIVNLNYSGLTASNGTYTLNNVPASDTYSTVSGYVYKTFDVTVTDKNGCSTTKKVAVLQNTAVEASIAITSGLVCPGDNSGFIETTATGGTNTFTYRLWRDNAAYSGWVDLPSFAVEIGHTYAVEVKDGKGCTAVSNALVIDEPKGVSVELKETTCYGDAKASVIVKASGEEGRTFQVRYRLNTSATYSNWMDLDSNNELAIGNLIFADNTPTQNFYYFQVKDSQGCTSEEIEKSFVATQHPLEVTAVQAADQISASITITGGISPYSYKVGNGNVVTLPANNNTFQVVNLVVPSTDVTVYDAHGCMVTKTFTVDPISVVAAPAEGDAMEQTFNVVLTFNRDVTGVANAVAVDGATATVTGSGSEYTVAVTGEDLAEVTLTIGAGVVDAAGNEFAGASFSYTIGDNTAPELVVAQSTPATGTTLTNNHPTFVLTFNEDVQLGTGKLNVYKVGGTSTPVISVPVTGATVSGKTITVTYDNTVVGGLDKNTDYYVLVDAGVVKDMAGNGSVALTDPAAWTFKTGDFATGIDPVSGSLKVYPNPFVDYINIASSVKLSKVVLTNIAGQKVKEVVNPGNVISTSELRSGVYIITLFEGDVIAKTERIVKK
jgi:hypothetical protein